MTTLDEVRRVLLELARTPAGLREDEIPAEHRQEIAAELHNNNLVRWRGSRLVLTGRGWWTLKPEWPSLAPSLFMHLQALADAVRGLDVTPGMTVPMKEISALAGIADSEQSALAWSILTLLGPFSGVSGEPGLGTVAFNREAFDPKVWARCLSADPWPLTIRGDGEEPRVAPERSGLRLLPASLDWALAHVKKYSDTDKFPHPFEIDVMTRAWSSLRPALLEIDLTKHSWSGARQVLVPKDNVSFRSASQLDPIDAILFAALIYEYAQLIEARRCPLSSNRVFSYRVECDADGTLFGQDQWDAFWASSIAQSHAASVVLVMDITDFYNQIPHLSLQDQLQRCGLPPAATNAILLAVRSTTGSMQTGIPVGPHPAHILAEASLISVDELLTQRGFSFTRYVDDIHVFCANTEEAQLAVYALAGALNQVHRLTPNRSKTSLMQAEDFRALAMRKGQDEPINSTEADVLQVIKKYAAGPYTAIPVSQLEDDDLAQLSRSALESIVSSYLNAQERDYVRLRYFLRRIAQVGVPGAVDHLVLNLTELLPAVAEIANYLNAAAPRYEGSWPDIGSRLLEFLRSPIARESEYLQIVILGIFARIAETDHINLLTSRYTSSSASAQRKIVLAATNARADAWLRSLKGGFTRYDPWLRRALAYASRTFPRSEREAWNETIVPSATLLERLILLDSLSSDRGPPTAQPPMPATRALYKYDIFISHASEDKATIARPLADALTKAGLTVWFDETSIDIGDSLRRTIDHGLSNCRFGIVILSRHFLEKEWPQRELDALVARETNSGEKAILPIRHEIDHATLLRYSPTLADKLAARTEDGIEVLVEKIVRVVRR